MLNEDRFHSMDNLETSLPELSKLIDERLALLRSLADSLETSSLALVQNDSEAIARGAAHQAELCRQWNRLEEELRREAGPPSSPSAAGVSGSSPQTKSLQSGQSARLFFFFKQKTAYEMGFEKPDIGWISPSISF